MIVAEKQAPVAGEQAARLSDIKIAMGGMISGISDDEEFYGNILDKLTMCGQDVCICLRSISLKWIFLQRETPKAGGGKDVRTPSI